MLTSITALSWYQQLVEITQGAVCSALLPWASHHLLPSRSVAFNPSNM